MNQSFVKAMAVDKLGYSSVAVKEKIDDHTTPPKGFGARHTQALILFICLTVAYSLRAHLSITMVAMTTNQCDRFNSSDVRYTEGLKGDRNNTDFKRENRPMDEMVNIVDRIAARCGEDIKGWSVYRSYNWSKPTQEMILYSFFVGYTSMMLPMGVIAQRFGGKMPIMIALGANSVLSFMTPWVPIVGGWLGVCVVRLLQGMTQAAFYPSIHTILGKWAPLSERGRLSTYIYTGSQFGTILAFQLAGLFAGSPALGWPVSFWAAGAASLVCFCLLAWLGAATPYDHTSIRLEELSYIVGESYIDNAPKKRRTPWKHILLSKPVWGIVVTHAGSVLGYLLILTQLPLYMNKILHVDIKSNGVFSSLPYIAMYLLTLVFGYLSDFCANRKIMSIANIRRTANTIGMVVSCLFLVAFTFVHSTLVAVTLLVLCLGTHSGVHVGFHINQIDLAPNFAGPIMALGNMVGNLTSLLAPVLVSNIVGNDVTNQHKWQILFIIIAVIMALTNVVFVVVVKGTVQEWNFYGDDEVIEGEKLYSLQQKKTSLDADIRH